MQSIVSTTTSAAAAAAPDEEEKKDKREPRNDGGDEREGRDMSGLTSAIFPPRTRTSARNEASPLTTVPPCFFCCCRCSGRIFFKTRKKRLGRWFFFWTMI